MLVNATETLFSNVTNYDKNNVGWMLIINGEEYNFEYDFSATDHAFNNAGVSLKLRSVYPKSFSNEDIFTKNFKFPKYSDVSLIFTDKQLNLNYYFFNGFVKSQSNASLNPNEPKWLDIECVSNREWLTVETMDFPIIGMKPEAIIDKILAKLKNENIQKGVMDFKIDAQVLNYNTQNKTAFQILQMLQNITDTLMIFSDIESITTINFFDKEKLLSTLPYSIGDQFYQNNIIGRNTSDLGNFINQKLNAIFAIQYDDQLSQKTFWNDYDIIKFDFKVEHKNYANHIIVESEKVISTLERVARIDLQKSPNGVSLPYNVGEVNYSKTRIIDANGQPWRKVLVSETTMNKISDITFTRESNAITLNDRILGKGTLEFYYKTIHRSSISAQNQVEQKAIAQYSLGTGIITRHEKHNDLTNLLDMAKFADKYLSDGVGGTETLEITSKRPIWEIGMKVIINGTAQMKTDKMDGVFIVREIRYANKLGDEQFEYILVRGIDMRNNYNAFDSMSDRDNPLFSANMSVETVSYLQQNLNLVYHNKQIDCVDLPDDMGLEEELETTLDGNDDTKNLYKYGLVIVGKDTI